MGTLRTIKKYDPSGSYFVPGDSGGSRTRDFLDENQTSWTTRRRNRIFTIIAYLEKK